MNGSGKQSFYEIQLNNGSLIAAFLVAVALGVAVFMLGVMVGRGQSAAPAQDEGGWVEDIGSAEADLESGAGDPEFFEKVQESDDAGAGDLADTGSPAAPFEGDSTGGGQASPSAPPALDPAVAGLPPADPSLAEGFVIQVKSTPDRADADALQTALAEAGFPAWVIAGDVRGRTTYRVRVGRYRDSEDAAAVERVLQARPDVEETWVTRG